MATSTTVETLFTKLETQKKILTKCTDLYKSLNTHFTTLDKNLTHKSQTLTTQLETLSTNYQKALVDLSTRESSLPSRLHSLSSHVEALKEEGLKEVGKAAAGSDEVVVDLREMVRGHCRKMDGVGLVKTVISKRRETGNMRGVIREGLEKDCVDAARLVVEVVREFLSHRNDVKKGAVLTDRRWACNIIVGGLFTVEEIRGREVGIGQGAVFSRKAVERAEEVVREWREIAAVDSGSESGNGIGMGPAEAVMFLTFVMGFGLKEKVEEEFVRKLVVEFAVRKDMAILALPFFGDKVGG